MEYLSKFLLTYPIKGKTSLSIFNQQQYAWMYDFAR